MRLQKPEWDISRFQKGKREGIKVIERRAEWWLHYSNSNIRVVAVWGPHKRESRRGYRKLIKAQMEAEALVHKLEHAWPCTFLVKGYPYMPPAPSDSEGTG